MQLTLFFQIHDCITSKKFKSQTLLVSTRSNDNVEQNYFLRSDEFAMQLGNDFIKALDILIKFHILFDLKFAKELSNFYDFMKYLIGLGEDSDFNKNFFHTLKYYFT